MISVWSLKLVLASYGQNVLSHHLRTVPPVENLARGYALLHRSKGLLLPCGEKKIV